MCDIEVTSADGETRQMTARFNMGKPLGIVASVPAQINLAKPFKATVEARDANGDRKPLEMKYTVTLDTAIVAEGLVADGDVTPVLKHINRKCCKAGNIGDGIFKKLAASCIFDLRR